MKKVWYILALVIISFVAILLFFEITDRTDIFGSTATEVAEEIKYSPPTEEEKNAGDEQKDKIIDNSDKTGIIEQNDATSGSASGGSNNTNVVITDASQYGNEIEVRAFAPNVIEDGTCTFTFTKGSARLEKQTPANADASSTPCVTLTVDRTEFINAGMWELEVAYKSGSYTGIQSTELEIK